MSTKVYFSFEEEIKKVTEDLESLPQDLKNQFNQAVEQTAIAAHASIVARAQAQLNSTRQDYLKGLTIEKVNDNTYFINLDGSWANKLEDGFPSYNLTEVLLRSQKTVEVGRRSGEPWVQKSKKDKHKFAYVPLQRNPHTKAPKGADMAEMIRSMKATNRATGRRQKITSTFKDLEGSPVSGLVGIGRSEDSNLDNLVKYQRVYEDAKGKTRVDSIYMNYRAVSEAGKPWIHPGYSGLAAFSEAEREIERQITNIVKNLLGD